MKRSLQEVVELVVFGLIALLIGTGVLWLGGWVLGWVGLLLKFLAGLIWWLLRFIVPVAIVAGLIYFVVRVLQGDRSARQASPASTAPASTAPAGTTPPATSAATAPAAVKEATVPEATVAEATVADASVEDTAPEDTATEGTAREDTAREDTAPADEPHDDGAPAPESDSEDDDKHN